MIRNSLQRFMYGRYGNDQLNTALLIAYFVLYILLIFTEFFLFNLLQLGLIAVAAFRLLSRNHSRRRAENAKYLKLVGPFIQWHRLKKTMRNDKEHCYFKCPSCSQQLRVPRGKGKITVTCRGCGASFQEKS